jgi:O-antigen ligase
MRARKIVVPRLDLISAESPTVGRALDADSLIRTFLLTAVFLLLWISFRPFESLAEPPEVTGVGNIANQVGYSLLFLVLAAWTFFHQPSRLMLLVRPILIATLLWFALSAVTSWEPSLSARRLAFTLLTIGIAGMVMLVPKNVRQFSDVMTAVVLIVLVLCYLGVVFSPSLSIHQSSDFLEPELAGDWRGVFGHKNEASAAMVLFTFIGLFVGRVRGAVLGAAIIVPALTFLLFTQSKTSIAMLPLVLIISAIMARVRRPATGIAMALSGVAIFNILSVGSIYSEPVRNLLDQVLTDSTFTGRTEVWQFVLDHVMERPITGFGFASFWGTPEVVYGMGGYAIWANTAGHAHNGYLDLALTIGIPGAVLVILWLVLLPLIDFYRSPHEPSAVPLEMLFLRVCLFAAYGSCFESMLLQEGGAALFLFAATFALRLLSVSRLTP